MSELDSRIFSNTSIFRGLDQSVAEAACERCSWNRYEAGIQILSENDRSTDLFFVLEGGVSARGFSEKGKEVTYSEIRAGGIFGEFSAIDGKPRSACIDTLESSLIARMSSDDFRSLIVKHSELGLAVAEHLVQKSRDLTKRVFQFGVHTVPDRVRIELLNMCEQFPEQDDTVLIAPAPTHYEIATRIATHREAVTRELAQLESAGLVEIGRKSIKVLSIKRLRRHFLSME